METTVEISSMAAQMEIKINQLKRHAEDLEATANAKSQKILDDAEVERNRMMLEVRAERRKLDELLETLPRVCHQMQGHIKLNIGGSVFETSTDTLQASHWFSTLLSGKFQVKLDPRGAVFVDRDGTNFKVILNFLRMGANAFKGSDLSAQQKLQLIEEAEYYQLQELSGLLASPAVGQKAKVRIPSKKLEELNITEELLHECDGPSPSDHCKGKHPPGKCNCWRCSWGGSYVTRCKCKDGGHVPSYLQIDGYNHNAGEPLWSVTFKGHLFELGRDCVPLCKDPEPDFSVSMRTMVEEIVSRKMKAAKGDDS